MNKFLGVTLLAACVSLAGCDGTDLHKTKSATPILPFLNGGPQTVTVDFGGSIDRKTILIAEICINNAVYLVTSAGGITAKIGDERSVSHTTYGAVSC